MTIRSKEIPENISERLLYRNQFILGPRFAEEFPSWKQISLGGNLFLTVHPALNSEHVAKGNRSVTLLGYILDPCNPHHGDADILNSLLTGDCSQSHFIERTFRLGGRWVLLVRDRDNAWLMHDATGLRQVCFTDYQNSEELWCASQPGLLSLLLNYSVDKEAADYLKSDKVREDSEFMWPGGSTAYKEVTRLLPNHCLDLVSGVEKRYWPAKPLNNLPLDHAIKRISDTLRGLMVSVNNRYELALGLTAGLDSRLVLAASRDICKEMRFVTVKQEWMSDDHADLTVSEELLTTLGLSHIIIDGSVEPDKEFLQIFNNNVSFAHERMYASDACAIQKYNDNRLVAVTGSASEIARCYLRLPVSDMKCVTAKRIAKMEGMGSHSCAVNAFERWLNGISDSYNVNLLDLLTWEIGSGSWLSTTQLEFDIAWKDIFTPYNCRQLLSDMMSVRESYRNAPACKLYMKLIDSLWVETLSVPINPQNQVNHNFKLLKAIQRYISRRVRKRFSGECARDSAGT